MNDKGNINQGMAVLGTVKAEAVNDFEFVPDGYNFEAKISVKIGNLVQTVTMKWEESGNPFAADRPREAVVYYPDSSIKKAMTDLGVVVDWADVTRAYVELAAAEKQRRLDAEQAARGLEWDNSWAHAFIKGTKVVGKAYTMEVSIEREKYVGKAGERGWRPDPNNIGVRVNYRGRTMEIIRRSLRYERTPSAYGLGGFDLSGYRAKKPETALARIFTVIDEKIAKEQRAKDVEDERAVTIKTAKARLAGLKVEEGWNGLNSFKLEVAPYKHVEFSYYRAKDGEAETIYIKGVDVALSLDDFLAVVVIVGRAQKRAEDKKGKGNA